MHKVYKDLIPHTSYQDTPDHNKAIPKGGDGDAKAPLCPNHLRPKCDTLTN